MRVILKPAGLLLLGGAFTVLAVSVLILSRQMKANGNAVLAAGASPMPAASATPGPDLVNPGFEDGFTTVVPYDNKAKLSGDVAASWKDDSSWAYIDAAYAREDAGCHSGKACQRVELRSAERSGTTPSAVQFNQPLQLTLGRRYRGSFFLKADRPVEAEVSFRQVDWPYHYYGAKVVKVGTDWSEATAEARLTESAKVYLMVKVWTPATVWIDDASLKEEGE
jgi:hypothetical protein